MKPDRDIAATVVLELTVSNHAGALSHVCGLFARRAFPLDGILFLPMSDARHSRIWLRVRRDERLDHVENQLRRLHDVHTVRRRQPPRAMIGYFIADADQRSDIADEGNAAAAPAFDPPGQSPVY